MGASGVVLANDVSRRSLESLERKATRDHLANIKTVDDISAHLILVFKPQAQ